jgi:2-amino-4-hydroxy-6-hydroxymethyldihydropteridine diphosphokinase
MRSQGAVVVYLGLGANLGDRAAALHGAIGALQTAGVEPLRLSPIYESAYLGPGAAQPRYLNAVLEARTTLPPLALLDTAQAVERAHGRPANTHGQPRTLDVDLLLYGDWIVRHPQLAVPHPRLEARRFVLQPLADLGILATRPQLARALAALGATQPLRRASELEPAVAGGAGAIPVA